MKSTEIGKLIRTELLKDKDIKALVSNNIYPIVAPANTPYPFVVYSRNNVTCEYSKDGNTTDYIDFQIIAVDSNYDTVTDIAQKIRTLLECKRYDSILDIKVDSITENYSEEAYTVQLNLKIINLNR